MLKRSPVHNSKYVDDGDLISWATLFFEHVHTTGNILCAKPGPLVGAHGTGQLIEYYKDFLWPRLFPKGKQGDDKVPVDMLPGLDKGGRTLPDFGVRDTDDDEWQPLPAPDVVLEGEDTVEGDVLGDPAEGICGEIQERPSDSELPNPFDGDIELLLTKKGCRCIAGEWTLSDSDISDISLAANELLTQIKNRGPEKKVLVLGVWSAFFCARDGISLEEQHLAKDGKTVVPTRYATTRGYAKEAVRLGIEAKANNADYAIGRLGVEQSVIDAGYYEGYEIGSFGIGQKYVERSTRSETTTAMFLSRKGWAPSAGEPRVDRAWKVLVRKEFIGDLAELAFNYLKSQGYEPDTRYAAEINLSEETSDGDTLP